MKPFDELPALIVIVAVMGLFRLLVWAVMRSKEG